jgi:hypothetical protein
MLGSGDQYIVAVVDVQAFLLQATIMPLMASNTLEP